jgi:hypothetical protein
MICCISWFFKILNIVFFDLYITEYMVTTTWSERVKPITNRWERVRPETDWDWRIRPINFFQPLEDFENTVCNEDWNIIYIFANQWVPISMTNWTPRE